MKIDYQKNSRTLNINDIPVILPDYIWQVFELKDRAIVITNPDGDMRNGYCFDSNGTLLWQIGEPDFFKGRPMDIGFEMIYFGQGRWDGRLIAQCRGRPFFLDIDTGITTFIPNVPDRM